MHPYHVRRFLRLTVACAVLVGAIIAAAGVAGLAAAPVAPLGVRELGASELPGLLRAVARGDRLVFLAGSQVPRPRRSSAPSARRPSR